MFDQYSHRKCSQLDSRPEMERLKSKQEDYRLSITKGSTGCWLSSLPTSRNDFDFSNVQKPALFPTSSLGQKKISRHFEITNKEDKTRSTWNEKLLVGFSIFHSNPLDHQDLECDFQAYPQLRTVLVFRTLAWGKPPMTLTVVKNTQ